MLKRLLTLFTFLLVSVSVQAQIDNPVSWTFEYEKKGSNQYELIFHAEVEDPWYLYSHDIEPGGPIPTDILLEDSEGITMQEIREEGDRHVEYDEFFDMEVGFYFEAATFRRTIELEPGVENVAGFIEFMACDGEVCTPPLEHEFAFAPEVSEETEEAAGTAEEAEKEAEQNDNGWVIEQDDDGTGEGAEDIGDPVDWHFDIEQTGKSQVKIIFRAEVDEGWYIYAPDISQDAEVHPIPTSIEVSDTESIVTESDISWDTDPESGFDEVFEMDIRYFKDKVVFSRLYEIQGEADEISGFVEYMACDDTQCTPPLETPFVLDIPEGVLIAESEKEETTALISATEESEALGWVFLGGIIGGLLALLTPCVFPMIMLTVSFFTNRKSSKGIYEAGMFGLSIILIYIFFGVVISLLLGPGTTQSIASDPWLNLAFFIVFVLFAASFFGAFEIKLPNSWANRFDEQSGRGGLIGVFFMALTLVVVSFSCTGPILGTLLIEATVGGGQLGPLIGITGFSIAFAVPYVVFAIFPSLLQKLPQSGGWMNTIKVFLGFVILGLALRFLSISASVAHWDFLPRDIFIVLWIVITLMLGFYLLGKLRFAHDSEVSHVSVPRLFLAILSFGFAFYLIPGLWGAPLNMLAGWIPSPSTQEFNINRESSEEYDLIMADRNYSENLSCLANIPCFFDYFEALEHAKEVNKPMLVDFTGLSCTNCKRMEANVLSKSPVRQRLKDEFVLVQLYVDDRTSMPENDEFRYVGQKWQKLQQEKFATISLPYYVILDPNEQLLAEPRVYDPSLDAYVEWLDNGLNKFNAGESLQTLR